MISDFSDPQRDLFHVIPIPQEIALVHEQSFFAKTIVFRTMIFFSILFQSFLGINGLETAGIEHFFDEGFLIERAGVARADADSFFIHSFEEAGSGQAVKRFAIVFHHEEIIGVANSSQNIGLEILNQELFDFPKT